MYMRSEPPKPVPANEVIFEATKEHQGEPVSTGSMFHLSTQQLLACRDRALQGDVDSAVKLYEFYTFSEVNNNERLFWMKKSAELGNATLQYSYSLYLLEEGDREEAIKWANISSSNGHVKAKEMLDHLTLK